jgi:hypothetical protein
MMRTAQAWVVFAAAILAGRPAPANDGPVILLQGGSIKPVDEANVQLVSEKVRITTYGPPVKGVYYMSRVKVHYVLENLSDEAVAVTTGFPFSNCVYAHKELIEDFTDFSMRDGKKKVPIEEVIKGTADDPVCWVVTDLEFGGREKKKVSISYRQQWKGVFDSVKGIDDEELVYMLTPARHWAGRVEQADIAFSIKRWRRDPFSGDWSKVEPCSVAFSIEPDGIEKKQKELVARWSFEDWEPTGDLAITYSKGPCDPTD